MQTSAAQHGAPPARRSVFSFTLVLALLAGAGVYVGYMSSQEGTYPSTSSFLNMETESVKKMSSEVEISIQTEYEKNSGSGTGIASDLNYGPIAQAHKLNYLTRSDGASVVWYIDGQVLHNGEPVQTARYNFPKIGTWTVQAGYDVETTVYSKIVRRELRDLTDEDRYRYFAAVQQMYNLNIDEGFKLYGRYFQTATELIAHHLAGAADKECDHWHDDAGMVNHHVGVTWKFEQSLRMIDPTTASHYWDYTRDTADHWYKSSIFDDNYFGPASPDNPEHIVDSGNFAYLSVVKHAREFSLIYNPYGMLRSPWNTNPRPFLMRHNTTAGLFADGYTQFPTCSNFADVIGDPISTLIFELNGLLHGPVHLMVGGHWNVDKRMEMATKDLLTWGADLFLLLSKFLWRQGIIRMPESCSYDAEESECKAWCPTQILGDDISAELFISRYGLRNVSEYIHGIVETAMENYHMTNEDVVAALCEVGYPGELFTSAAPQDPIFWPLHGPAERFIQALRIWKDIGKITFDETWSYDHVADVPSDTHRVCDWSGVEGLELPTCTPGICSGHKGEDILPFTGIINQASTETWTNLEFYTYIHPNNKDVPYVYDSVSVWKGCTDDSLWTEYIKVVKGDIVVQATHAENSLPKSAHIENGVMS